MLLDTNVAISVLEGLDPTSPEFKEAVARLLGRLDPKQAAGTVLCDAIMGVWTSIAFEVMAFRVGKDGVIEIFLIQRDKKNTAYAGQWHAPGALYRHGEQDIDVARRLRGELGCDIVSFKLVDRHITNEARGTIMSLIFLVEVVGEVRIDDRHGWFPVDQFPEPMVDFHRVYIKGALAAFLAATQI